MFIVNKTDSIQRVRVLGEKRDVKPGEIIELNETDGKAMLSIHTNIFGISEEATIRKEVKKSKK